MSNQAGWRSGGGQPGYYTCSHGTCQKKVRNVDNWGRSRELLSGDHACCGHSKHSEDHIYRERDRAAREAAEAAGPPAVDPSRACVPTGSGDWPAPARQEAAMMKPRTARDLEGQRRAHGVPPSLTGRATDQRAHAPGQA